MYKYNNLNILRTGRNLITKLQQKAENEYMQNEPRPCVWNLENINVLPNRKELLVRHLAARAALALDTNNCHML